MSKFVPNKEHSRSALVFCFHLKKTAAESYRLLREAYGEHAPSQDTCERWFRRFKSGDFDIADKEHGKPEKRYEDAELQALLDEDDTQTQKQLAEQLNVSQQAVSNRLREMGKIQKVGRWVPHELNERQMERRKNTCEILLERYKRKSFLHRIVTGDEKWVYFKNPKRKKSWVDPGAPSTSTARPNRFGMKTMLCVWWDQKGVVYYELLKPGETVNTKRYKQQLIDLNRSLLEKRPEYRKRQHKVIFLHDNAPHTAKLVRGTLETLSWEVLHHAAYSPDLAPSDYHLFASMGHALAEQRFGTAEKGIVEVTNCFCVPHKESESQVEADLTYGMDLYDLNHRVNAQENIVGWWATGNEVTTHSSVIHEYYVRECNNPVHLTVDTTLANTTRMGIKAYVCVPLGVPNGKQGSMFTPVKVQIACYEPEVVGLQLCSKTQVPSHAQASGIKSAGGIEPMMDLAQVSEACSKLSLMLEQVLAYVDDVLAGKQLPDNQVGRALLDMVHSVPKMTSDQFDDMFNSNVKDLLMVVALSQLIKTQLQLNEKLTLLTTL